MEQKKKDQIIQKLVEILECHNWGEDKLSFRFSVTVDNEKEKEMYEYSERV